MRSTVDLHEMGGERGMDRGRLGDGVGDQVRERQPSGSDGGIELLPTRDQDIDRDVTERGRGRDAEARGHVGDQTRGDPLDWHRTGRTELADVLPASLPRRLTGGMRYS